MDRSSNEALRLMRAALEILDDCGAPADVGAHLDLAIARLEGRADGVSAEPVLEAAGTRETAAVPDVPIAGDRRN